MLHVLFPFQLRNSKIRLDVIKGEKWNEFMYEFAQSFYSVKQTRNNAAHIASLKGDDLENAVETIKKVIGKIREIGEEKNKRKGR